MNSRELKKLLNESAFNPKQPSGPIKIILDTKNPNYYENRAIELIMSAQGHPDTPEYHDDIRKAISLLVMARLARTPASAPVSKCPANENGRDCILDIGHTGQHVDSNAIRWNEISGGEPRCKAIHEGRCCIRIERHGGMHISSDDWRWV